MIKSKLLSFEDNFSQILNLNYVWDTLKNAVSPIFLYGMGKGADIILNIMNKKGIVPTGIFANDEFVRGHNFRGFKVERYSDVCKKYNDFIVVLCYAANNSKVISRIKEIANAHPFYAPDLPVVHFQTGTYNIDEYLFDHEFLRKHKTELKAAYNLLADEQSRFVFNNIIRFKITGDIKYLSECETEKSEALGLLKLENDETIIDCGAYNGDTILEMLEFTNKNYKQIYAIEPDIKNFTKLKRNLSFLQNDVHFINAAVYDKLSADENIKFTSYSSKSSHITNFNEENKNISTNKSVDILNETSLNVPGEQITNNSSGTPLDIDIITLDSLKVRPTLIKMDIEGAELNALNGSEKTITKYHPKLYICAYHRNEDLFSLPLKIKSLHDGYKIYLRHHPYIPAFETNIYGIIT